MITTKSSLLLWMLCLCITSCPLAGWPSLPPCTIHKSLEPMPCNPQVLMHASPRATLARTKGYSTRYPRVVTQRSTDLAQPRLPYVIGRERCYSGWYDRSTQTKCFPIITNKTTREGQHSINCRTRCAPCPLPNQKTAGPSKVKLQTAMITAWESGHLDPCCAKNAAVPSEPPAPEPAY